MRRLHVFTMLSALAVLANCSSELPTIEYKNNFADNPASARFANIGIGDDLEAGITTYAGGTGSVDNQIGEIVYELGYDREDGQAVTASGYQMDEGVGAAVTSGKVSYSTDYGLGVLAGITREGGSSGVATIDANSRYRYEQSMTLTADFDQGTLTGSDETLDFNGTISGSDIGGTVDVYYDDSYSSGGYVTLNSTLTAELDGKIGADGVIGRFKGVKGKTDSVAGGFVGLAD